MRGEQLTDAELQLLDADSEKFEKIITR